MPGENPMPGENQSGTRQSSSSSPTKIHLHAPIPHLRRGDVVGFLDLPDVSDVAYDCTFLTTEKFIGVRDVPAGPHFFWVSPPSAIATRSGVWIVGSNSQQHCHVVQWDKYNETLTEAPRSETRNFVDNISQVHARLVRYEDPSAIGEAAGIYSPSMIEMRSGIWRQLTTHVTAAVLDRVAGPQVGGWVVHTLDRAQGLAQFSTEIELDRAVPNKNLQQRELHFAFERTARLFSLQSIGSERTEQANDSTTYLVSQIQDPQKDLKFGDLVAELQFCFVVGVHLSNEACLEQWWFMLLKLILKADRLMRQEPLLVASIWHTVAAQITYSTEYMESSVLDGNDSRCKDLRIGLIIYKLRMKEVFELDNSSPSVDHLALCSAFSRLEAVLTTIGWDISGDYVRKGMVMMEDGEEVELELSDLEAEDERGEWAPEMVEFDENGRQSDLISLSE
jgi:A1 cistron-splicing factor AAR2